MCFITYFLPVNTRKSCFCNFYKSTDNLIFCVPLLAFTNNNVFAKKKLLVDHQTLFLYVSVPTKLLCSQKNFLTLLVSKVILVQT